MSEFSLIDKYFSQLGESRKDVIIGVGDDAAVVKGGDGELCLCVDTLVRGVHFPDNTSAEDVAYKSLAVNLSDMAAMGAQAKWVTIALTLTDLENESWIKAFALGIHELANQFHVQIIGGDTTRGEQLVVTVQVIGNVNNAITRCDAKPGDAVYVTGTIGDAGIGLQRANSSGNEDYFVNRLNRPKPRLIESQLLKPFMNSAIDISDGLLADLNHILENSRVGTTLDLSKVPFHPLIKNNLSNTQDCIPLVTAGDDYELCFSVSSSNCEKVEDIARQNNFLITRIATIESIPGLRIVDEHQREVFITRKGYDHFTKEG